MNLNCKLVAIVTLVLAIGAASQNGNHKTPPRQPNPREDYIGDEACRSCHQDKVETFHRTAHYLTSSRPDKDSILGTFSPNENILRTSNPDLFFRMEAKDDAFFQTAVQGIPPYITSRTERFGLVVGSGGKGQTFLFWKADLLFSAARLVLEGSWLGEQPWVSRRGCVFRSTSDSTLS